MELLRISCDDSDGTRSAGVAVDLEERAFAAGVPPLLVSQPMSCGAVSFVEFPTSVRNTAPHVAPRRQLGAVLTGIAETETTDGEVRLLHPGSVVLLEDTHGRGHITRIIEGPFRVMFVSLDGEPER